MVESCAAAGKVSVTRPRISVGWHRPELGLETIQERVQRGPSASDRITSDPTPEQLHKIGRDGSVVVGERPDRPEGGRETREQALQRRLVATSPVRGASFYASTPDRALDTDELRRGVHGTPRRLRLMQSRRIGPRCDSFPEQFGLVRKNLDSDERVEGRSGSLVPDGPWRAALDHVIDDTEMDRMAIEFVQLSSDRGSLPV